VVTTVLEHNSVLRPLYEMEQSGTELVIIGCEQAPKEADEEEKEKVRRQGKLDYEALKAAITPGTRAVVMTHASNLTGNRTDLKKVGDWCQKAGVLFIVDAAVRSLFGQPHQRRLRGRGIPPGLAARYRCDSAGEQPLPRSPVPERLCRRRAAHL